MSYKTTILSTHGCLQLSKSVHNKGSTKYIIKLKTFLHDNIMDIDLLLNPHGNRLISGSLYMWKFNTRHEAEELMLLAVLKGWSLNKRKGQLI